MILKARRAVRRRIQGKWTQRTWPVVGLSTVLLAGAGAFTSYLSLEAAFVALVGLLVLVSVEGFAYVDQCVECGERVDVKNDSYCSVCGESLSAIPYRPADLVDEEASDLEKMNVVDWSDDSGGSA